MFRPITKFTNVDNPIAMAVVTKDSDAPDLSSLKKPGDELIQSPSLEEALSRLTASKLERKAMVIAYGAASNRVLPGGILYLTAEPSEITKTLVVLHNQYVIEFSGTNPTSTVDVVIKPPRGLPSLTAVWTESRGVDRLLKIAQ